MRMSIAFFAEAALATSIARALGGASVEFSASPPLSS